MGSGFKLVGEGVGRLVATRDQRGGASPHVNPSTPSGDGACTEDMMSLPDTNPPEPLAPNPGEPAPPTPDEPLAPNPVEPTIPLD